MLHIKKSWKDTILNVKIQKYFKQKGFTLLTTAVSAIVVILLSQCFFIMAAGSMGLIKSEKASLQAEQNANLDIAKIKALDYEELANGAHSRETLSDIGDGKWQSEVTIGDEQTIGSDDNETKLKIATVKVYREGDTLPRYSVDIPVTSLSSQGGSGNSDTGNGAVESGCKVFSYYASRPFITVPQNVKVIEAHVDNSSPNLLYTRYLKVNPNQILGLSTTVHRPDHGLDRYTWYVNGVDINTATGNPSLHLCWSNEINTKYGNSSFDINLTY